MKLTHSLTSKKHSSFLRSLPRNHLHQCICLCLGISNFSYAGPDGGEVVGGAGSISRSGNTTTINQATDRMAIDWQSYDVGASERVHYVQPDSSSVSLNRILSNTGSNIQGRIDANGQVILMNPHGILFGKDSVVNAGGILASGLNIDASDFMNGDFTFGAVDDTDGVVINAGTLNAALGGSVSLIGKEVKNDGLISAQLGSVTFAAGREAVVSFDANSMVSVRITQALLEEDIGVDAAVINNGEINAEDGQILLTGSTSRDIFSQAVNAGDLDAAYSVVMDDDGSFTLGAGADVVNTGVLSASGDAGGAVVLLGENITHSGEIHADSYQSDVAGMVEVHSVDTTLLTDNSIISANAEQGAGGVIKVLGERVGLVEQAMVIADGASAGGEVLVGGDYRGENANIRNAAATYAGAESYISASATQDGEGGRVILWGDDQLSALGILNATGAKYGSGGFIETSSAFVNLNPSVSVNSEFGNSGTWLIDPYDITIQSGGSTNLESSVVSPFDTVFLPNSDDGVASSSILTTTSLRSSLAGGSNVLVETTGSSGGQEGDITLASSLDYDGRGDASLTLRAHDDIQINASIFDSSPIFTSDSLNLTLIANYTTAGDANDGDITIDTAVSINTQGGSFTATGSSFTSDGATLNVSSDTGGGNIDIDVTGDATVGIVTIGDTRTSSEPTNPINFTTSTFDVDAANIISDGNITFGPNDDEPNHTTNLTYTATGDITFNSVIVDNGSGGNDILNMSLNAGASAGVITIHEDTSIWLDTGNFTATGHDFTLGSISSIDSGRLDTEGGDVDLFLSGDIRVGNWIDTDGGAFTVGDSSGGIYGSSFDNYLTGNGGDITTDGGAITITTIVDASANGDVTIGTIDNGADADVMSGNVTVTSGNNITLESDYDFHDTATGPIDSDTTDPTFTTLTLTADNSIAINGLIYDSSAPSGDTGLRNQDTLNVVVAANQQSGNTTGHVTLTDDIYTAGGTVAISGANFDSADQIIHTGFASATEAGYTTTGGHITFDMSGTATLGEITTEGGDAFGNLNVSATSIADNGSQDIDVAGTSTFTAEGGVLAITLDNSGHTFTDDITIASDQATLALGDITINTDGTAVGITATGAITQATLTDAITLNSSSLQVTADSGQVQLQNIDTSGSANSAGGSVTVTASAGAISVGTVTTNGGTAGNNTVGQNAGAVTLTATGTVSAGDIQAVGSDGHDNNNNGSAQYDGGSGGDIAISSSGGGAISLAGVSSDGGNGHAQQDQNEDDANGGDAGYVYVNTTGQLNLGGDITARGGRLWDNDGGSSSNGTTRTYSSSGIAITLNGSSLVLTDDVIVDASLTPVFMHPDEPTRSSNRVEDAFPQNIAFGGAIEGTTAGEEDLSIYGADITFGGNLGAGTSLGAVVIGESDTAITNVIGPLAAAVDATGRTINSSALSVTANTFTVSDIDTSGPADTVGGNIIIAVNTALTTGDLETFGGASSSGGGYVGGDIDLDATDLIVGIIDASGSDAVSGTGGNGGVVTLTATENNGTPSIQVNGDINVNAGSGDTDGTTTAASLTLAGSSTTSGSVILNTTSFISSDISITGTGQSTDTLTGLDDSSYWVSLATGDGSILDAVSGSETVTIGFTGFELLQGGSADDHFSVGHNFTSISGGDGTDEFTTVANTTGRLLGEGGVDTFHINHDVNDSVDDNGDVVGGEANDIFNVAGGITVELDGGNGTADTLNLVDTTGSHSWALSGASAGTLNTDIEFVSMEQLNGATGALGDADPDGGDDQFTFNFPGNYGGADGGINARGGDNDSVLVTTAGTYEITLGENLFGVVSAETIASNGASDGASFILQLVSDVDAAGDINTWTINGVNDGSVSDGTNSINFTNFASLEGNQGNDRFNVQTGASIVAVQGVRTAGSLVTDEQNSLLLADGTNTWALTTATAHAGTITGGHSTGFGQIQSITGAGGDTLTARDQQNTWTINTVSSVAQNITDPGDTLIFAGMSRLNGNSITDDFTFERDFIGTVYGGGNSDTFVINTLVQATINGDAGEDTFTFGNGGSMSGTINGGDNVDTIEGRNLGSTWTLSGDYSGSTGFVTTFNGIEVLDGRGGDDIFLVSNSAANITRIIGGTGSDRIDFRSSVDAFDVVIDEDNQGSDSFRVTGVEWLAGASGQANTLTVESAADDEYRWELEDYNDDVGNFVVVDGEDDGQVHRIDTDGTTILSTVNYTEFDDLTGGAGDDTFVIGINDADVDIDGGGTGDTADTLVGFSTDNIWLITDENTGQLTFGTSGNVDFEDIENLTGSDAAADQFTFQESGGLEGSITGTIEAGDSDGIIDIADFSGVDSEQNLVIGGSAGGVNGAERIVGNIAHVANNTLTGNASFYVWTVGDFNGDAGVGDTVDGVNDGTVTDDLDTETIEFVNFGFLQGSGADDTFIIENDGTILDIRGGGGTDTIQGRTIASDWSITGGNSGGVRDAVDIYVDEFQGIETLTGADDISDIFTIADGGSFTGTINGGTNATSGSDQLRVASSFSDPDNRENRWEFSTTTSQVLRVANDDSRSGAAVFTGIEQLTGGVGNDVFVFGDDVSLVSTITSIHGNNGSGTDTVDLSALTTGPTYVATFSDDTTENTLDVTRDSAAIYSVQGVEHVIGNDESNVRLTSGATGTNTWEINAGSQTLTNTSDGQVSFANVAYLLGSTNGDTFEIAAGASFTGTLDGVGATNNSLEWLVGGNTWTLNTVHGGTVAGTNFSNIQSITGSGDTLVGHAQNNHWVIDGGDTGTVKLTGDADANQVRFIGMANVHGNTGDDRFDIASGGSISGLIRGTRVLGTDTLNDRIDFASTNTDVVTWNIGGTGDVAGNDFTQIELFNGDDGQDIFIIDDSAMSATVDGAGNTSTAGDTLRLADTYVVEAAWTLDGAADQVAASGGGTVGFSNIEMADGANNARDTFAIQVASVDSVSGRDGNDQFTIDNSVNADIDLVVVGGDGDDELVGGARDNDWIFGGAVTDEVDTLNYRSATNRGVVFSEMEDFTGATGDDSFVLRSGAIVGDIDGGSAGTNTLTVASTSGTVNWTIDGANTGDVTGVGEGFSRITHLQGDGAADVFTFQGLSASIADVNGGAGTNTLVVDRASGTTQWHVDGVNSGSVTGVVTRFDATENLTGGDATDTFSVDDVNANVTGLIDGAGGANDSLNVEVLVSGVVIELGDTVTGTNPEGGTLTNLHVNNIESLTAAADGDEAADPDTEANNWLVSNLAGDYRWDIDARNEGDINLTSAGTLNPISFTNFAHLEGGEGSDTFQFYDGGVVTAIFDGGNGSDQANFSNVNGAIEIALNAAAPVINFTDIEDVVGNHDGTEGETDTARLTVATGANDWTIDEVNAGNVDTEVTDITFSGFNQLQGGSGLDTFDIDGDGTITGWINGGDGTPTDVVDARGANNAVTAQVLLAATDATTFGRLNIQSIERIRASGAGNTLYAATTGANEWDVTSANTGTLNTDLAFEGFDALVGNALVDEVTVRNGASLADVNGAGGDDTLIVESAADAIGEVNWFISAENEGQVSGRVTHFEQVENLTGGEGADRFTFTATTASLLGLIDGGEAALATDPNTDVLDVSVFTNGVVVELGPVVAAGSLVEGTATLANVNAHNVEDIRAAAGDEEAGEENNNWLAIASDAAIDWDLELDTATSEHNEGQLQEIISAVDPTAIANTQTLFFNFGSIQGGSGGAQTNIITGADFPTTNLTGEYRRGTGENALIFEGDAFHVVEIDALVVGVTGNNNVLLRVASTSDFNGENAWEIHGDNAGSFNADYEDFSFNFTGVNFLEGGSGNDTFTFVDGVDDLGNPSSGNLIDGSIHGGGGTNIVNVNTASATHDFGVSHASDTAWVQGVENTTFPEVLTESVFLVENRNGVTDLVNIGELNVDTPNTTSLVSADSGAFTWNIGSFENNSQLIDTVNSLTLTFNGVDSVAGGDASDTFNVLQTGIVSSVFDGGGGTGSDTLNIASLDDALRLSVDPTQTTNIDMHVIDFENLTATDVGHTLVAGSVVNTWTIDDVNGGTLAFNNGSDQALAFTNVRHLVGGDSEDIFRFTLAGNITGTLHGGGETVNPDRIDVQNDATNSFVFQVGELDADAAVIDNDITRIEVVDIERIDAANVQSNTLVGAENSNNTWAVGVNNTLTVGADVIQFSGFDHLTGGSQQDLFGFDGATVNGLVDGGGHEVGAEDAITIQNLADGTAVRLGNQITTEINVANVESVTAIEPNNYVLIGEDNTNAWIVQGENAGTVDGVTFSGFASLVGGTGNDTFTLSRQDGAGEDDSVASIDGGAEPVTGTATDRVDLTGLVDSVVVSLDPDYVADLIVANVETIDGADNGNTLVGGNDIAQQWDITSLDGGRINATDFTGFAHVLGRTQVDQFIFDSDGAISGTVDGGSQPVDERDVVDLRDADNANVVIGDTTSGFLNIEEYRGNNRDSVLTAADVRNEWEISDANGGSIDGVITFSGFTDLEGGSDVDIFTLAGGSVSGEIRAGAGNDRLEIDLASGFSGDVTFVGNDNDDTIVIDGGDTDTRFSSTYTPSFDTDGVPQSSLTYAITTDDVAHSYRVEYTDVETVNDRVYVDEMTVNNVVGRDDILTLANNRFTVNGFTDLGFTNKNAIAVQGESGDQLIIEGRVSFNDAVSISNVSVSGEDENAVIDANRQIAFNTTGNVGSAANRLSIETNSVALNAVNGDVYLDQTGDLIIAQLSNPVGLVDIDATGSITDAAALNSANAMRLVSGGDIQLDNDNSLTGTLTLAAQNGAVVLTNGTTNLMDVTAQDFTLTTSGNVSDGGVIQIANATTINAANTSIVTLDGANNTFNTVDVTNAGTVVINDSSANGVIIQGAASDSFVLTAINSVTANAITADDIALTSTDASVVIQNTLTAQNAVAINGEGVTVNGSINVLASTADRAVLIDANSGALGIQAAIVADADIPGDIELLGQSVQQFAGATISGRDVVVTSESDVTLAADVTATQNLSVTADGVIVMNNGVAPTSTTAQILAFVAGGDISTQQLVADIVSLTSETGGVTQQGDITAREVTITANDGEYESETGTQLTLTDGELSVTALSVNTQGDIQSDSAITFDVVQSWLTSGDISAAGVSANAGEQIAMTPTSQISSDADIALTAGSDIQLSQLTAQSGTVSLVTGGAVSDNNGDATNVGATSLFARSETGFGSAGSVNTAVANLDVQNATGVIGIANNQEVTVTSLINNGDIRFVNSDGNVIMANVTEGEYDRSTADARDAGGVINANYTSGDINLLIPNGYLAATPGASSVRPELVGDVINVSTSDGFGFDRQLVVYANTELIVSGPGIRPIWGFGEPPAFGLTTDSDLIDPSVIGSVSDLLVDVEAIEDVDPAIFTNVRNYVLDQISIRMPRDQVYDDDDAYEYDEEDDREHDEGYYY